MTQTTTVTALRFQVTTTTVLSTGNTAWVIVDTVDTTWDGKGSRAYGTGQYRSPESAQRKADALNAATKTPAPLTEQQAQDLADRVNATPGLIGRASIEYHARSGRWGIFLTDRVGCDVNLGQTVEGVEAFLARRDSTYFAAPAAPTEVPAPAAPAPIAVRVGSHNITDDIRTALDAYSTDHDAATYVAQCIAYNAGAGSPGDDHGDLEFTWAEFLLAQDAIARYRAQVAGSRTAAPASATITTAADLDHDDRASSRLDTPKRVAMVIDDACQRSLDAKRLIWVASFDPGAEWGQGRCWYNTDVEPSTADRIEGTARAGHYMPVCQPS